MDPKNIDLFTLAQQRIDWISNRQGVIAQNIANADTPGWKERDVAPFASVLAGRGVGADGPVRTDPRHLGGTVPLMPGAAEVRGEQAPDGNAVSIDEQMTKLAQTESDHEAVTAIYKKYLGLFHEVLGH